MINTLQLLNGTPMGHSISQRLGALICPDAPCRGLKAFEIFPNAFVVCEVDTSAMRIA